MRCPVCRAADNQGRQCRRCKADLSLLVQLEDARARHLATAGALASRGDPAAAEHAEHAYRLRADTDAARLAAAGNLLRRDFLAAWHWLQRSVHET
jgi:hypothetical protein